LPTAAYSSSRSPHCICDQTDANLFSELKDAQVVVLQATEEAIFPEDQKEKLYNYLKNHYSRIDFKDLRDCWNA
jgi:hypothetical protein